MQLFTANYQYLLIFLKIILKIFFRISVKTSNYNFFLEKPPATVPSTVIPKPPPFLTELTSQDKRNNNVITQTNSNHATTSSSLYATTAKQTGNLI